MRLFSFNERNPTVRNLRKLLEQELGALPEDDQQQYFRQRQRPRQSNKPLVMQGMSRPLPRCGPSRRPSHD
jgi:hypothetical protein